MKITGTGIAIALAVVVALGFLLFGSGVFSLLNPAAVDSSAATMGTTSTVQTTDQSQSSLMITDETMGTGAAVKAGDTVSVTYTGMLSDGTVFDASANHGNQPFTFTVGAGQVIAGWDQGLVGMKVGGTRKLVIPPDQGYGAQGAGNVIPPNATLTFEIKLLKVQ